MTSDTNNLVPCETQTGSTTLVDPASLIQRFSAYGLLRRQDKILVVKTHSAKWELPGGTPEPGETLLQALERETLEETGMRVAVKNLFYVRESFYSSPSGKAYHSMQYFFHVESEEAPKSTAETKEVAFVATKDLREDSLNHSSYLAIQNSGADRINFEAYPVNR